MKVYIGLIQTKNKMYVVISSVLLLPSVYDFKMHFVFAGMKTWADVLNVLMFIGLFTIVIVEE